GMLSLFKACSKQTRPDFPAVIEIARYSFSIPVILQVALLDGNANDVRPEGCDAAATGMPDAWVTNSIAPGLASSLPNRWLTANEFGSRIASHLHNASKSQIDPCFLTRI